MKLSRNDYLLNLNLSNLKDLILFGLECTDCPCNFLLINKILGDLISISKLKSIHLKLYLDNSTLDNLFN